MIDRAQPLRPRFEVTNPAAVNVQLDAVPVMPGLGGHDVDLWIELDLSHAPQHFAEDRPLLFQLEIIGNMLVLATAALIEVRAGRVDPRRRRLNHCQEPAAHQIVLRAFYIGTHDLAGKNIRREHNAPIQAREAVASVHKFFNSEFGFVRQA